MRRWQRQSSGRLDVAIRTERDRQVAAQLTAPEIAEKLDAVRIRRFVRERGLCRICAAEEVLRELAFITALPAAEVLAAQGRALPDSAAEPQVLVQGIADLVLVYPDHLELLDYKTDRRKTSRFFARLPRPAGPVRHGHRQALRPHNRGLTYKGIAEKYSLELGNC